MEKLVKYGICKLTVIPLRKEPAHTSEMVSQLLFGEAYAVKAISDDLKWFFIQTIYDNYCGWIQYSQHHEVSEMYFVEYRRKHQKFKFLKQKYALVGRKHDTEFLISLGSVLPFEQKNSIDLEQYELEVLDKPYKVKVKAELPLERQIAMQAEKFLGTPYLWGGRSIFGIDCSGFVQQVFKTIPVPVFLPRDSSQQAKMGVEVDFSEARTGDLAFFANAKGNIHHVGIMLSEKTIIHASGEVKIDKIDRQGIKNKIFGHTHQLAFVKRLPLMQKDDEMA